MSTSDRNVTVGSRGVFAEVPAGTAGDPPARGDAVTTFVQRGW
jgi:hypothetical protein